MVEVNEKAEESASIKGNEVNESISIQDVLDFFENAKLKLDKISDHPLAKKLLENLREQLQKITDKYEAFKSKYSERLSALKTQIEADILKFDNATELKKLGITKDQYESKEGFEIYFDGKSIHLELNDNFQIEYLAFENKNIHLKYPINIADLPLFFRNLKIALKNLDNSKLSLKGHQEIEAENMICFSFWNNNEKYMLIAQEFGFFKVEDPLSQSEKDIVLVGKDNSKTHLNIISSDGAQLTTLKKGKDLPEMRKKFADGICHEELTFGEQGEIETKTKFIEGKPQEEIYYSKETNKPIFTIKFLPKLAIHFYAKDGREFGNYQYEKQKDPGLTPDKYIQILAQIFNSPESWQIFTEQFMSFVWDKPDEKTNYKMEDGRKIGDHWQTPDETLTNTDKIGRALGDCEDYAFLAQAILLKQGIKAHVIGIPGHALCVWINKRADGKYDAFSIDTSGYDKNGNVGGEKHDPEKEKGYLTAKEALNSLFKKYKTTAIKGIEKPIDYTIKNDEVEVLSIPERGKSKTDTFKIEDLINK